MTIYNGSTGNDSFASTTGEDVYNYGSVTYSGDLITATRGNDTVAGSAGFDKLVFANVAIDSVYGTRTGSDFVLYLQPNTAWNDDSTTKTLGSVTLAGVYAGSGVIERIDFSDAYFLASATSGVLRLEVRDYGNVVHGTYFLGGVGNDSVVGTALGDGLKGDAGNDTLSGGNGNDDVNGDAGNDVLLGGAGDDTIHGGAGTDTVSYSGANGLVFINLSVGRASFSLEAFPNPKSVGAVNDTIEGGAGTGTVAYSGPEGAVAPDLGASPDSAAAWPNRGATNVGTDTLEGVENAIGSAYADRLVGSYSSNRLDGGAGNDILIGLGGNDSLIGGAGQDHFLLAGANGAGNDTIDGGTITDLLNYLDLNSVSYSLSAAKGVSVNLATGLATDAEGGTDTLRNINAVYGTSFNDTLTGSTLMLFELFSLGRGNDRVDGGAITDTLNEVNSNCASFSKAGDIDDPPVVVDLAAGTATGHGSDQLVNINHVRGGDSNDTLRGSNTTVFTETFEGMASNDRLDGRGGLDVARYDYATTGVNVNLATGNATVVAGSDVDTLVAIEGVRGSHLNDTLTGGNTASAALEFFRGNGGNDVINGGAGYDRVDYVSAFRGVTVQLGGSADGTATDGMPVLAGQLVALGTAGAVFGTDTLRGIEAVRGSDFNDTLNGSGITTEETFEGRKGADVIDGNGGADRVSYFTSTAGATVTLGLSGAAGSAADGWGTTDTLRDIENVQGSRDFADRITGNELANVIDGLGGNDTLSGGAGNDTLIGGAGNDSLVGGAGLDAFLFNAALNGTTNVDRIGSFVVADDTIRLENAVFTALTTTGTLASGAFVKGTAAADSGDRVIYDSATGNLWYDSDGTGAAAKILFANVAAGTLLTNADFVIV